MDLPEAALELVFDGLAGKGCSKEDKNSLRLVFKRSRALVDERVVAVRATFWQPPAAGKLLDAEQRISTLVRAPWRLQRLLLGGWQLGPRAAMLATGSWSASDMLRLNDNCLDSEAAAAQPT